MEEARQHPPVELSGWFTVAVVLVAPALMIVSLIAAPFIGGTPLVVTAALWLASRTAWQFHAFAKFKQAAHSDAKWAAIKGVVWLLLTILFFKFVVWHHFIYVRA